MTRRSNAYDPDVEITDDGERVKQKYKDGTTKTVIIAQYQQEWIEAYRDAGESFNLSKIVRRGLDRAIEQSEYDLPDNVVEEGEEDNLQVFVQ